ncbi:hypothetical protein BSZ35_00165 [Salinibacter sp. 10B]|uniref:endonuclease/exonuclease/phosphatase family protein n=1 Tax=Salinibacter sp. 10B TaxID=1923971 RepID=UPI000CF55836|nr:endonuclease/exonuclease/phosphatase family protein [Salinibacter sp. 10B]PQJ36803.1 hypothetical protein BSZ35_00165 [Salinibacter sp. 10B]
MSDSFRLATYNIEWFNRLFDEENELDLSESDSNGHGPTKAERAEAIATVLETIDPDLLTVIEGPDKTKTGRSTVEALENFASYFDLRISEAATGFRSNGSQEIGLMFDPERVSVQHAPGGQPLESLTTSEEVENPEEEVGQLADILDGEGLEPTPRFDGAYTFDIRDNEVNEIHNFYRPPFEAKVTLKQEDGENVQFRTISAHLKSKGIFDAYDRLQHRKTSLRNRRKILAQAQWIRYRVDEFLNQGDEVVVMGDFNDGPGFDYFERRFGQSSMETVMGDVGEPAKILRNPFTDPEWGEYGWSPATAAFYQEKTGKYFNTLIDYVMVSRGLAQKSDPDWEIFHPYQNERFDKEENGDLVEVRDAFKKASDHYPVTVDLAFS